MPLSGTRKWEEGRGRSLRGDRCLTTTKSWSRPQNECYFPPAIKCPYSQVQYKQIWNSVHFLPVQLSILSFARTLLWIPVSDSAVWVLTFPCLAHAVAPSRKIPLSSSSAIPCSTRISNVTFSEDAALLPFVHTPNIYNLLDSFPPTRYKWPWESYLLSALVLSHIMR